MASRPVPSYGAVGLGSHPLTCRTTVEPSERAVGFFKPFGHREGGATRPRSESRLLARLRGEPGCLTERQHFSNALCCTVLGARRALQVLTSHLEALAVLPSHRASFPEPFYCPKWRGG